MSWEGDEVDPCSIGAGVFAVLSDLAWISLHMRHVKLRFVVLDRAITSDLLRPSHLEWVHLLHAWQYIELDLTPLSHMEHG